MSANLQRQLEEYLDPRSKLRFFPKFPKELEDRYAKDQRSARTRETLIIGFVAILLFDLFLFSDYALDPQQIHSFIFYRLCVFTPCSLLALYLVKRSKRRAVGDVLMLAIVSMASLFWLMTCFNHSPSLSALAIAGQIVYQLFGTIVLRLSFPASVAINILLTGEACGFLYTDLWMNSPEKITCLGLVLSCSILALLAIYRMEIGQRISYLLFLREDFRSKDLALLNEVLATQSNHDGLTGLANRRYLDKYFQQVCDQAGLEHFPVSIVMADIDHFKQLNDRFGHTLGDVVLIGMAEVLRTSVRDKEDLVARFGGEEFVIVFPGMDRTQACETAERLCSSVRNTNFTLPGTDAVLHLSISCGVATSPGTALHLPIKLINQADEALYRAKNNGRDQAWCGDEKDRLLSKDVTIKNMTDPL
jgi:diguanylate cyclase (GGDEF)-like protein